MHALPHVHVATRSPRSSSAAYECATMLIKQAQMACQSKPTLYITYLDGCNQLEMACDFVTDVRVVNSQNVTLESDMFDVPIEPIYQ